MSDERNKQLNRFLGAAFRLRRLSVGMPADRVAAETGKSTAQVYRLETGQSWRLTDWIAMCEALGYDPDRAARELAETMRLFRLGHRAPSPEAFGTVLPPETVGAT